MSITRRGLLLGRLRAAVDKAQRAVEQCGVAIAPPPADRPPVQRVAVIQGRRCMAYRGLGCSTCVEKCPIPGAIVLREGAPQVVADLCDGCGICREACPAPVNAILMLTRKES